MGEIDTAVRSNVVIAGRIACHCLSRKLMLNVLRSLPLPRRRYGADTVIPQPPRVLAAIALIVVSVMIAGSRPAAAAGELDTDFGAGLGKVVTSIISNGSSATSRALSTVLLPGGKVMTLGICNAAEFGTLQPCFARYNADGSLDPGFNGTGKRAISMPSLPSGSKLDTFGDAIVRTDGKVVASIVINSAIGSSEGFGTLLIRLNADGTPDASFGSGPEPGVIARLSGEVQLSRLARLADGRIVAAGMCPGTACVTRLNEDGSVDQGFGVAGFAALPPGLLGSPLSMVVLSSGKLLFGLQCDAALGSGLCVARLLANGDVDTGFAGGSGVRAVNIGSGTAELGGMAVQANGSIVLSGACSSSGGVNSICMARLAEDGIALDTSFSVDGIVSQLFTGVNNFGSVRASVQDDGRIVLAAECRSTATTFWSLCAFRFNPDGSTDSSFGSGGRAGAAIASSATAATREAPTDVILQPDGKLLIAASCDVLNAGERPRFCMARLQGGPQTARRCGLDIDGDGTVTLGIDALLLARISAGVTGSAVTAGIAFPTVATRKTWPDIRSYLVDQCGQNVGP